MIKSYDLYKTKAKTLKANNLMKSTNTVYEQPNVMLDLSIMDELNIPKEDKESIVKDICDWQMWLENLDVLIIPFDKTNGFKSFTGKFKSVTHKVYDKDSGKRLYCIKQYTEVFIIKKTRDSIYDREGKEEYRIHHGNSHTYFAEEDIEI